MSFFYNDNKNANWISETAADSSTSNSTYLFWRDHLFERMIRLFVWENTFEVPQKEIEQRLLLQGYYLSINLEVVGRNIFVKMNFERKKLA